MNVKRAESGGRAASRRFAQQPSPPSKKIFVFPLLSLAVFSAAGRAQDPPKVTLERVVDGRGNRVCDVAKAVLAAGGVTRSAWVVRGLVRDDLVLTLDVVGKESHLHTISLDGRPPLRFETSGARGRITVASPVSTFRYFEGDLARKTVRCNLSRLAEEADRDLLGAAAEYLEQGLEDDGLSPEELPVFALAAVEKRPAPAIAPTRRTVPWTDGGPAAEELAAAARALLAR